MSTSVKNGYSVTCVFCSNKFVVEAFPEDVKRCENGELIQDAMPYLAPEWRELLISGTCPGCWDFIYGYSDED